MADKTPSDQTLLRRFTEAILTETPQKEKAIDIYGKLLFSRFEEVIDNAFGRVKPFYDPEAWNTMILKLIAHGGESPYIWQLPETFLKIAAAEERRDFIAELFWFEWMDIYLSKVPEQTGRQPSFLAAHPYFIAPTATVKRLTYPVHRHENDPMLSTMEPHPHELLLFRDPKTHQVMVTEITPFMYDLLSDLNGETPLEDAVRHTARIYQEEPDEVWEIILPTLRQMTELKILI